MIHPTHRWKWRAGPVSPRVGNVKNRPEPDRAGRSVINPPRRLAAIFIILAVRNASRRHRRRDRDKRYTRHRRSMTGMNVAPKCSRSGHQTLP
jgi:hypothetical protein